MADTQTLSDPFKLPKGNADTSGKIPGQKDYNKNSQIKNTYKIDIPTRAGQTTGANENNPVAVYRVGVTQPIGTITSQSGFTPNPTYYSGVSAAEEKIRKAEQRAVREQIVEINKQVIKPTAEKAKIKPPIKDNEAATDPKKDPEGGTPPPEVDVVSLTTITPNDASKDALKIIKEKLTYPLNAKLEDNDMLKIKIHDYEKSGFGGKKDSLEFNMKSMTERLKEENTISTIYLPAQNSSGISDSLTVGWGSGDLNPVTAQFARLAYETIGGGDDLKNAFKSFTEGVGDTANRFKGASGELKQMIVNYFTEQAVLESNPAV